MRSERRYQRIRRGVFKSVAELEAAIDDYLTKHNADPKPFIRTKKADAILEKNVRARAALETVKIGNQALECQNTSLIARTILAKFTRHRQFDFY